MLSHTHRVGLPSMSAPSESYLLRHGCAAWALGTPPLTLALSYLTQQMGVTVTELSL